MYRDQNAGRSHWVKFDNSSIERVGRVRTFGNDVSNDAILEL
jgi:hypothetical protein